MYNCLGPFTVETLLNDVVHDVDIYITLNDVVHHGHGVFPPTLHDSTCPLSSQLHHPFLFILCKLDGPFRL